MRAPIKTAWHNFLVPFLNSDGFPVRRHVVSFLWRGVSLPLLRFLVTFADPFLRLRHPISWILLSSPSKFPIAPHPPLIFGYNGALSCRLRGFYPSMFRICIGNHRLSFPLLWSFLTLFVGCFNSLRPCPPPHGSELPFYSSNSGRCPSFLVPRISPPLLSSTWLFVLLDGRLDPRVTPFFSCRVFFPFLLERLFSMPFSATGLEPSSFLPIAPFFPQFFFTLVS